MVNLRSDLPETIGKAAIQVMLQMEQSEVGKQTLHNFEETTRFDLLSATSQSHLQQIAPTVLSILDSGP